MTKKKLLDYAQSEFVIIADDIDNLLTLLEGAGDGDVTNWTPTN